MTLGQQDEQSEWTSELLLNYPGILFVRINFRCGRLMSIYEIHASLEDKVHLKFTRGYWRQDITHNDGSLDDCALNM